MCVCNNNALVGWGCGCDVMMWCCDGSTPPHYNHSTITPSKYHCMYMYIKREKHNI